MTRQEKYLARVHQHAREAILDIPNVSLLSARTPAQLIDSFSTQWGTRPKAVILPATSPDGVNYPNVCQLPESGSLARPFGERIDLADAIHDFGAAGCDIYLSLDPAFEFVTAHPLMTVDSVGATSLQLCITKQQSQEIVSDVITDGIMLAYEALAGLEGSKLRGIVFDSVDLWPMSAEDERIELTCFCEACVEKLVERGVEDPLGKLRTFPNPANLLLAENESKTGITYVDTVTSLMSPSHVVGLCRMKGFDASMQARSESELEADADFLLRYLRARHQLTVDTLRSIFEAACNAASAEIGQNLSSSILEIILTEGEPYNWTSGLFLDWLDTWEDDFGSKPCDEVWFDPTSSGVRLRSLTSRAYMWRRSRYFIDAFFGAVSSLSDEKARSTTGWSRYDQSQSGMLLRLRRRQAIASRMDGLVSLLALDSSASRVGFVGVGLDDDIAMRIQESTTIVDT